MGDDVGPNCWLETNQIMADNNGKTPENNNIARRGYFARLTLKEIND
jgi:hypothetical protein